MGLITVFIFWEVMAIGEGDPDGAAWFGFAACVVLVIGAKAVAIFLKRPDTYYDD